VAAEIINVALANSFAVIVRFLMVSGDATYRRAGWMIMASIGWVAKRLSGAMIAASCKLQAAGRKRS